jgi:hypothetical protein
MSVIEIILTLCDWVPVPHHDEVSLNFNSLNFSSLENIGHPV